jgi:hypothetical protein
MFSFYRDKTSTEIEKLQTYRLRYCMQLCMNINEIIESGKHFNLK